MYRPESNHKYYETHKEQRIAYIKKWKEENPDKFKEHQKKYRSTEHYKELKKEHNRRYREKLKLRKQQELEEAEKMEEDVDDYEGRKEDFEYDSYREALMAEEFLKEN